MKVEKDQVKVRNFLILTNTLWLWLRIFEGDGLVHDVLKNLNRHDIISKRFEGSQNETHWTELVEITEMLNILTFQLL